MAVPGRISAGRAGLAESALLPDTKVRNRMTLKTPQRLGTVKIRGMELAQRSPKDN